LRCSIDVRVNAEGLARGREHGAACDAEITDPVDPAVEIDAPRFGSTCMRLVPCAMLTS
jgi:hypothetical protein